MQRGVELGQVHRKARISVTDMQYEPKHMPVSRRRSNHEADTANRLLWTLICISWQQPCPQNAFEHTHATFKRTVQSRWELAAVRTSRRASPVYAISV